MVSHFLRKRGPNTKKRPFLVIFWPFFKDRHRPKFSIHYVIFYISHPLRVYCALNKYFSAKNSRKMKIPPFLRNGQP